MRNGRPPGAPAVHSGGQGLDGLAERVALAGGALTHGGAARRRLGADGLATLAGMTIAVLIVDDDPLVRAGLTMMLGGAPTSASLGEAADGAQVAGLVDTLAPDVILMDIRMPDHGRPGRDRAGARSKPDAPEVIVLTTFDADEHVLRALRAGAAGFLLKDTPPAEIVEAVREVARGNPVLSPQVTRRLMDRVAETGHDRRKAVALARLATLNAREREVAVAVGHGGSNAQIGAELYLSVPTVKTHVSSILAKLGFNNRVQIALLVHDAGLISEPPR